MMIKFMVFILMVETCFSKITARPASDLFELGFSNFEKRDVELKNSSVYPVATEKSIPDNKIEKEGVEGPPDMGSATEPNPSVYQADVEPSGTNKSFQLTDLLKNNSSYAATLLEYGINVPNNVLTCNNVSVINVNITLLAPNCNCSCGPGPKVSVESASNLPALETITIYSTTQQIEGATVTAVEGITGTESAAGEISTTSLTSTVQIEGITGTETVTGETLSTVSITNTTQIEGITGTETVTGETLSTISITNTTQIEGITGTETVTGETLSTIPITNTTQIEGITGTVNENIIGTEGVTGETLNTTASNITEQIETVTGETLSTVSITNTTQIEGITGTVNESIIGTEGVTGETLNTTASNITEQIETVTGETLSTVPITNTTQIEGITGTVNESIIGTEGVTGETLNTAASTEQSETVTGEVLSTTLIANGSQQIEGSTESLPTNLSTEVITGEVSAGELLESTVTQSTPVTVSEISPVEAQSLPYYTTCITVYRTLSKTQTNEIIQTDISSTTSINSVFLRKNVSFFETKTTDGAISEADVAAIHSISNSSGPTLRTKSSTAHLIDSVLNTTSSMVSDSSNSIQVSEGVTENVSDQVRDVTADKKSEQSNAIHLLESILKTVTSPSSGSSQFLNASNRITETTIETVSDVVTATPSVELSGKSEMPKSAKLVEKPLKSVKSLKPKTHRRRRRNRYALNIKY